MPALLDVRSLTVQFLTGEGTTAITAVRDLSFSIAEGEVLGLVGESGSGKSVTSLALMRLLAPLARATGEILYNNGSKNLLQISGEDMRHLRGSSIAMIFQEPMTALNPVMRVGDQIAEAVLAHASVSKKEAHERAVTAMQDVAIPIPSAALATTHTNSPAECASAL